jgi:hypothetical protein
VVARSSSASGLLLFTALRSPPFRKASGLCHQSFDHSEVIHFTCSRLSSLSVAGRSGFDPNPVLHSTMDPLRASEVFLGCLHGNVPEQKLDLL